MVLFRPTRLLLSHALITFSEEQKDNHANDLIITGLIIDETLTKGGHNFYDLFNERLSDLQLKNNIGSSDFGVINKIVKKQYDIPINYLVDSKIITTFKWLQCISTDFKNIS